MSTSGTTKERNAAVMARHSWIEMELRVRGMVMLAAALNALNERLLREQLAYDQTGRCRPLEAIEYFTKALEQEAEDAVKLFDALTDEQEAA